LEASSTWVAARVLAPRTRSGDWRLAAAILGDVVQDALFDHHLHGSDAARLHDALGA
jgi:hypothetical protein